MKMNLNAEGRLARLVLYRALLGSRKVSAERPEPARAGRGPPDLRLRVFAA